MKELKTLKDFETDYNPEDPEYISVAELKAEAVKWVKNYLAGIEYHDKQALNKTISFEDSQILNTLLKDRIDFIKYFFNLTEEDLK